MGFLLPLIIGVLIGYSLGRGHESPQIANHLTKQKKERKQHILEYLQEHESITNDRVQEMFDVGNTTAYRYLEELETEEKIEQIGETGKSVKYSLK